MDTIIVGTAGGGLIALPIVYLIYGEVAPNHVYGAFLGSFLTSIVTYFVNKS